MIAGLATVDSSRHFIEPLDGQAKLTPVTILVPDVGSKSIEASGLDPRKPFLEWQTSFWLIRLPRSM